MPGYIVARTQDIPPGTRKQVEVRGRPIVIFNLGGEYFALLDRCPHQGAQLSRGCLVGLVEAGAAPGDYRYTRANEIIRCPWHGWEFDIRTGQSRCEPDRIRATHYDVSVERGGDVGTLADIRGVETFSVAVEDDYIVLTL